MSQTGADDAAEQAWATQVGSRGPLSSGADQLLSLFDLALSHIAQGVCVFDGNQRLRYCNRRYAELYGLDLGDIKPGSSLRDIVDRRYAAGTGPDMQPDEYSAWRRQIMIYDRVVDSEVKLRDGRTFHIHHEPLRDGGWVATHHDITSQREAETRVRYMALHDALTGLPNRAQFTDRLEATLLQICRSCGSSPVSLPGPPARPSPRSDAAGLDVDNGGSEGWVVAVLFIDLDHFKDVNDTLGHAAGDKLLQLVSARIASVLLDVDLLARLGGDEFAVLVSRPGAGSTGKASGSDEEIGQLARSVIDAVEIPFALGDIEARVGASIGITTCTEQQASCDLALLMRQADMALYRAKADGRGALRFFDQSMLDALHRRTELERDLRHALDAHQIVPHFQPLLDLRSGAIVGVEALARWHHPAEGRIEPSEFIAVAESAGLICRLGEQILRDACAKAAGWNVRLAVNLSPEQVRRPGLIEVVADALAQSGLPPHLLELEITETLLLNVTTPTLSKLSQLRDMGIGIVLDDFGTGYCSLSYLDRFPFTKLKIDRSFVAKLFRSDTAPAIIQAIVTMGHTLSLRVSAEGIETPDQLEQLRSMGCDEVQGYLLGRPEDAEAFEARLADRLPTGSKNPP